MKHSNGFAYLGPDTITTEDARAMGVELDAELEQLLTMPLEQLEQLAGLLAELVADPEHGGRAWRLEAPGEAA